MLTVEIRIRAKLSTRGFFIVVVGFGW